MLDGTKAGTSLINQSKKFVLVPEEPGHSLIAATIELSANRFLMDYFHGDLDKNAKSVSGVIRHLSLR
ncbi:MAG: hypothetical protein QF541_20760 [Lentisphaeria bacterium]|jgi:hypothetical protein|nr:hypothetical protein [Lentisphaeria bacterium]